MLPGRLGALLVFGEKWLDLGGSSHSTVGKPLEAGDSTPVWICQSSGGAVRWDLLPEVGVGRPLRVICVQRSGGSPSYDGRNIMSCCGGVVGLGV